MKSCHIPPLVNFCCFFLIKGAILRPDLPSTSSSNSSLPSPDQHQLSQEQQAQVQSSVSSAADGRDQVSYEWCHV